LKSAASVRSSLPEVQERGEYLRAEALSSYPPPGKMLSNLRFVEEKGIEEFASGRSGGSACSRP